MGRVNPVENLNDFAPKAGDKSQKPVESEIIDQVARDNDFPSRQAAGTIVAANAQRVQRRYVTGRNQQINIKATADTIARLYRKADELKVPLGEILDRAIAALEKKE